MPWDPLEDYLNYANQWANTPSTSGGGGAAAPTPTSSTTPNGIPKVPGFNNPYNPYDTGRHGEQNRELNGGNGGKVDGWDYDLGAPMAGIGLGSDGFYTFGGGGGGGAGGGGGGIYDGILSQFKTDMQAQGTADLASRDAAIKRQIGLFGDPGMDFGAASKSLGFDLGSIIDPQTQQIAKQSYESGVGTHARIEKAHKDAMRAVKNALAARGALRSGELGHQLKEEEGQYTNAQFDSRNALLELLSGYQRGFLEGERQRQMAYFNALLASAGRGTSTSSSNPQPNTAGKFPLVGGGENSLASNEAEGRLRSAWEAQQWKKAANPAVGPDGWANRFG